MLSNFKYLAWFSCGVWKNRFLKIRKKLALIANSFHGIFEPVKDSLVNMFNFITADFSKFLEKFFLF